MHTTIAYISNQFPSAVEPYVLEEAAALEGYGFRVVTVSGRRADSSWLAPHQAELASRTLYLGDVARLLRAGLFLLVHLPRAGKLLARLLWQGSESWGQRLRGLAHTLLGAELACHIRRHRVQHIHVHHGYFASWIALVAARLNRVGFSMTLHGSDLLLHGAFLDTKLENCDFCLTVSEFNRRYIMEGYPAIRADKIIVHRIGVEVPEPAESRLTRTAPLPRKYGCNLLAVGRLHPVKNFEFLLRACSLLKSRGLNFHCVIAGDGPERERLARLAADLDLGSQVELCGHVEHAALDRLYRAADIVALTSHSEGIPIVLMEAMARKAIVLAPEITGIPELVIHGQTGFLYRPGSIEDFVSRIEWLCSSPPSLAGVRNAARKHVRAHFEREKSLRSLCALFSQHLHTAEEAAGYADPVLQQI